jgi:hypothetical protein
LRDSLGFLAASEGAWGFGAAVIVAAGTVVGTILTNRTKRAAAPQQTLSESLRVTREGPATNEHALAIASLKTADPGPRIEKIDEEKWRRRKWGWLAGTILLGLATIILFGLGIYYLNDDISTSFVFTAYALGAEFAAFATLRRFKTMNSTTLTQAGSVQQTVHVRGELDRAIERAEEAISTTNIAVASIERQPDCTTFKGVPKSGTERITITLRDEADDRVSITVVSSSTPSSSSYRRNSANVLQFVEKLAGVRVFRRRGDSAWRPPESDQEALPVAAPPPDPGPAL